jgi:hypothetical protein
MHVNPELPQGNLANKDFPKETSFLAKKLPQLPELTEPLAEGYLHPSHQVVEVHREEPVDTELQDNKEELEPVAERHEATPLLHLDNIPTITDIAAVMCRSRFPPAPSR